MLNCATTCNFNWELVILMMKYHAMNKNIFQEVILSKKSYHFIFRTKNVIYNSEISFTGKTFNSKYIIFVYFENT